MLHALKRSLMHARGPWAAAPFLAGMLSACSPLNVLDTLVPAGEYDRQQGIAYGELPRQKLDIYRPVKDIQSGPVVVFFYGGSWKSGAREKYRFIGEALTRKGLTVVIPDYRLYPDVAFPAFMNDAAKAVRWTLDNLAGSVPGGPARTGRPVFLAGHSAGAHIAALMTVDSQYFDQAGVSSSQICGVIGISGPYAFDPLEYRSTRPVFAGLADSDIARPVKRITGPTPPFLLLHGDADGTVRPSNTAAFAAALRSAGTRVRTEFLPDIGHYRIILAMATPFDDTAPVNKRIFDFITDRKDCR
ncbi:MAG: acetyl esterase/lipase [Paracoccaceae bacterium]|jgi:acetyl esterase/lipase